MVLFSDLLYLRVCTSDFINAPSGLWHERETLSWALTNYELLVLMLFLGFWKRTNEDSHWMSKEVFFFPWLHARMYDVSAVILCITKRIKSLQVQMWKNRFQQFPWVTHFSLYTELWISCKLTFPNFKTTCDLHINNTVTDLQGNVPSHVDVAFKLIHPNFCHSEGVPTYMSRQVLGVGFVSTLYVGNVSTRQDLNAASTLPHLVLKSPNAKKNKENFFLQEQHSYSSAVVLKAYLKIFIWYPSTQSQNRPIPLKTLRAQLHRRLHRCCCYTL